MCILCGGQCGGVGEFLIALGLPFLVLYFSRMKKALIQLKNRIISRGSGAEKIQDNTIKCRCCGEWPDITKFNNWGKLEKKEGPKGVKGWLFLLCLNLTIVIPASCLYEANCTLDLFNYTKNKILLLMFNNLLLYNIVLIGTMVFLAIFSFYAGLRLWEIKLNAVKTAKTFLITQLSLTFIIVIISPFMTLPLGGKENILAEIMKRLIPSLLNFSLWYLYLSNSKRVYNTFSEIEKKRVIIRHLPAKLKGYTGLA
jgi:hypothetical protein